MTGKPNGSRSPESLEKTGTRAVANAVSWDAVAEEADNNQGTSSLHVSALDVASGTVLWQVSPVNVSALYQSSLQHVVDTQDGHLIWQYTGEQAGASVLSVHTGTLYLSTRDAQIAALDTSTGKLLWSYSKQNVFVSPPVVTTQAVYMVEYQLISPGAVSVSALALGVGDGKVVWRRSYGTTRDARITLVTNGSAAYAIKQVPSGPAADPFVPIASVQALDVDSGNILWEAQMAPDMEQISVLSVGNTLYLYGQYQLDQNQSLLVALQASDGKQLWLREHSHDQITLLGEQDLYGVSKQDGKIVWKLPWKSSSLSVQTLTLMTVVENQDVQSFMNQSFMNL